MSSANTTLSPDSPIADQPIIGLIGMGDMGRMYAKHLSNAGWRKINVCDQPSKFEELNKAYQGDVSDDLHRLGVAKLLQDVPAVTVFPDGHGVSRSSDFIIYSVPAEFIEKVVAQYGPSTKVNAIVAGQTSVKAPERKAFETHLPPDVSIVSIHSLHGPVISPIGQPLVLIQHRASKSALETVENILRPLGSRYVYMTYEEHDLVTANTQAVTHAAFLTMGTAWSNSKNYPWEQGQYVGGIETVKVNIMLRIYSNQWHVYAGLALLNPDAKIQIAQYAKSATEIFKLMLNVNEYDLQQRMEWARCKVFGGGGYTPILLSEDILDQFTLGAQTGPPTPTTSGSMANSHLSILAMVDCWAHLNIQPFHHLSLAATPIFRLFLGVAEYLFHPNSPHRLQSAINAALYNTSHREDDLEFVVASRGWAQCVDFGNFPLYEKRFKKARDYFESRFEEAGVLGGRMINAIIESGEKSE